MDWGSVHLCGDECLQGREHVDRRRAGPAGGRSVAVTQLTGGEESAARG